MRACYKNSLVFFRFLLKFEHNTRCDRFAFCLMQHFQKESVGLKNKELGSLEKKQFGMFVLTFRYMSGRDEWKRFRVLPIFLARLSIYIFLQCCK